MVVRGYIPDHCITNTWMNFTPCAWPMRLRRAGPAYCVAREQEERRWSCLITVSKVSLNGNSWEGILSDS